MIYNSLETFFLWMAVALPKFWKDKKTAVANRSKSQGLAGSTWQRNISLLAELHWKKLQASLITINSLLSACEKESQWLLALDFVILGSTLDGFRLFFTNFF